MKKKTKVLLCIILCSLLLLTYFWVEDNCLQITEYEYKSNKIGENFEGFTIVQISDLHGKSIGDNHSKMMSAIKELQPDIIVVTGDVVDRRRWNFDSAISFINQAVKIAPVYYIPGNHEAYSGKYEDIIKPVLKEAGCIVVDDEAIQIERNNEIINIIGLKCVGFLPKDYQKTYDLNEITELIKELKIDNCLNILLSHRPELMEQYKNSGVDIVFCGHAHGGQFIIPIINQGVLAPDQGWWPQYFIGAYTRENTTMYVSRGIGNSVCPIRINNRPEIISVTLKTDM